MDLRFLSERVVITFVYGIASQVVAGGGIGRVVSHPRNDYFNSAIEVAAAIAATTWEAIP